MDASESSALLVAEIANRSEDRSVDIGAVLAVLKILHPEVPELYLAQHVVNSTRMAGAKLLPDQRTSR